MHFYLLVLLICATPAFLIIDSPIEDGIIPAILALAVAFAARTIRPGQADHFFYLTRPVAIVAAVPAVWIIVQILPLGIVGGSIQFGKVPLLQLVTLFAGQSLLTRGSRFCPSPAI